MTWDIDIDPEAYQERMARVIERSAALTGPSLAERFAALPEHERDAIWERLSPADWVRLLYAWGFWGRPKQFAPGGDWDVWLVLAGRGFGKNRLAAQWIVDEIAEHEARTILLAGPTLQEIERYMIGGRRGRRYNGSGIRDVLPPWLTTNYRSDKGVLEFSNGAVAYVNSAERTELRGANFDRGWCDELCKWPRAYELWSNINLTMREPGIADERPRIVMTTTPKPMDLLRAIILESGTVTTHGITLENAKNVSKAWIERMQRTLGDTRQGRQELMAELLADNEHSLFSRTTIGRHRVTEAPDLVRVVVSVDPAISRTRYSDATGIVIVGLGADGDLYVLEDLTGRYTPEQWGDIAIKACADERADAVVERNRGGDLVKANLRAAADRGRFAMPHVCEVRAVGDKADRARPISTLYERGRVHHVGRLPRLEDEQISWDPTLPSTNRRSPNALDALCHGIYELTSIGDEPKPDLRETMQGLDMVRRELGRTKPGNRDKVGRRLVRPGRSVTKL